MEQCVRWALCAPRPQSRGVLPPLGGLHIQSSPRKGFPEPPESRSIAGAPTCRHEPPKPAVIKQAAKGCVVWEAGAARIQRGKAQKSYTNANVLPSKSPWSSQLKSVLNFPPLCLLGVGGGESRLPLAFQGHKS